MPMTKTARVVKVVPYDSSWRAKFAEEELVLRRVLGEEVQEAHHIGSTAIPGMWAKPIIDILVIVRDIEKVDRLNHSMSAVGYQAMGEFGIQGRRFFIKGGDHRTHHVHVFQKGSAHIRRHLDFRDFMIVHPKEAASYADLKRSLATRFGSDIDSYCRGKELFIVEIEAKAAIWAAAGRARKGHRKD